MIKEIMPVEEYKEYCRCWSLFLQWIGDKEKHCFRKVMDDEAANCETTVLEWPRVWPMIDHIFSLPGDRTHDATRRFVVAVQKAEKAEKG